MSTILVSGLINIETTLRIAEFPLAYNPVNYPFFGVNSTVSGVGYNLSKAMTMLGDEVRFLALIGTEDIASEQVRAALAHDRIDSSGVISQGKHTAQSVILYDSQGNRQIHVDLKDIQDQIYPPDLFQQALHGSDIVALCNINYSRLMLEASRASGKLVATDVHSISSLDDPYNQNFMQAAHILFMSHENLPVPPEEWAQAVMDRYQNEIVVIGLGSEGCLLAVRKDNLIQRIPAVFTRPVINTIGAGDALFSAFLHEYSIHQNHYQAIHKAVVFASYKVGATSAAEGFLSAAELHDWCRKVYGPGWE